MTGHPIWYETGEYRTLSNRIVLHNRMQVRMLRQAYRALRAAGASASSTRRALWNATWLGGLYPATFIPASQESHTDD